MQKSNRESEMQMTPRAAHKLKDEYYIGVFGFW